MKIKTCKSIIACKVECGTKKKFQIKRKQRAVLSLRYKLSTSDTDIKGLELDSIILLGLYGVSIFLY